jgi:hypothetical protein
VTLLVVGSGGYVGSGHFSRSGIPVATWGRDDDIRKATPARMEHLKATTAANCATAILLNTIQESMP